MPKKVQILVLLHEQPVNAESLAWTPFKDSIEQGADSVSVDMSSLDDLSFSIKTGGPPKVINLLRGKSITEYDLVIFRTIRDRKAQVSMCVQSLEAANVRFIDTVHKTGYFSKLSGDALRAQAGFPVVPSFHASSSHLKAIGTTNRLPFAYPLIVKSAGGRKGRDNYLAKDKESFLRSVGKMTDMNIIVQPFLDNDGDYRILVLGGKARLVIFRKATKGSHLNNTSAGSEATLRELSSVPAKVIKQAEDASKLAGLQLAGVDVLMDKNSGKYYFLEVNSSPQLISGAYIQEKTDVFINYIKEIIQYQ